MMTTPTARRIELADRVTLAVVGLAATAIGAAVGVNVAQWSNTARGHVVAAAVAAAFCLAVAALPELARRHRAGRECVRLDDQREAAERARESAVADRDQWRRTGRRNAARVAALRDELRHVSKAVAAYMERTGTTDPDLFVDAARAAFVTWDADECVRCGHTRAEHQRPSLGGGLPTCRCGCAAFAGPDDQPARHAPEGQAMQRTPPACARCGVALPEGTARYQGSHAFGGDAVNGTGWFVPAPVAVCVWCHSIADRRLS